MSNFTKLVRLTTAVSIAALISACGGGGGDGGGTGAGPGSGNGTGGQAISKTVISGRVVLSQYLSALQNNKATTPAQKMAGNASVPKGKPGTKAYQKSVISINQRTNHQGSRFFKSDTVVTNASVWLYDSNHPEWIYPVSESTTDSTGGYSLTVLKNSSENVDAEGNLGYTDGDGIPKGNYTLLAFTPGGFNPITGVTTDPIVAIQTIVNEFDGAAVGNDLVAQNSTVAPKVEAMFGQSKNTDGTQTWGSNSLSLPANAAIQVNFSMAMSRGSIAAGISIDPAVAGEWAISSDWLSATFYPDDGVNLTKATTYIVTVNGADSVNTTVKNVYGEAVKLTAVGTFTVPAGAAATDILNPNVVIISPNPLKNQGIDVITPIRVVSSEPLDVNNLLLESTPSLGAKPGVLPLGEAEDGGFVYEFILANPLALGTSYDLTISGGTDMAGNVMNARTASFLTAAAEDLAGVDATATAETQSVQTDVRDVFGRWIRSFNERNITQLQSLMEPAFIFEYNSGANGGGVDENDSNRDGRYDLAEFSSMIDGVFVLWDYCGTVMDGEVIGDIVVDALTNEAKFEFTLIANSENSSQACNEAAPDQSLFASVSNVNGVWLISRMSEGVDTLDRDIVLRNVMPATLSQLDTATDNVTFIEDGGNLFTTPTFDEASGTFSDKYTFTWDAVEDASAYAFVIFNANDDFRGRAFVLPAGTTEWTLPLDKDVDGKGIVPSGVSKQHDLFGFSDKDLQGNRPKLRLGRDGEEFEWTVMALGTKTVADFEAERVQNPFDDIIASSTLNRYKNPGLVRKLGIDVSATSAPLVFNEIFNGYDAGAADTISITVTSPSFTVSGTVPLTKSDATGGGTAADPAAGGPGGCCGPSVNVNGVVSSFYPLTFDANGLVTVTVNLGNGFNWIDVNDGSGEFRSFSVQTTGGIMPPISIDNVLVTFADTTVVSYTADAWGYIDASLLLDGTQALSGATSVTIFGSVIGGDAATLLNFNMYSNIGANSFGSPTVNADGTFTITTDIYTGDNWIDFDTYFCPPSAATDPTVECTYGYANVGIFSGAGTAYVAPISEVQVILGVDAVGADILASKQDDWGNGGSWDASADDDSTIEITGTLQLPDGVTSFSDLRLNYSVGSDGGWSNNTTTPNTDGSFTLPVELYNGNNWIDLSVTDANDPNNWFDIYYNLNLYTSGGLQVIKPQITSVISSGVATFDGFGGIQTDSCSVTIMGTAIANGKLDVYWNGDSGIYDANFMPTSSGWENFTVTAGPEDLTNAGEGLGLFTVTISQLIGGANAYNSVSINDANFVGTYVDIRTSDTTCVYTAPVLTTSSITSPSAAASTAIIMDEQGGLTFDDGAGGSVYEYDAGADTTVTISGSSSDQGRTVFIELYACSGAERTSVTSDVNGDWSITANIYDGWNSLNVMDGTNNQYMTVTSSNAVYPVSPLTADVSAADANGSVVVNTLGEGCGYASYEAIGATSATITGTALVDGKGSYWDNNGSLVEFDIVNGDYSFDVTLIDGSNYYSINDADYNYMGVDINTTAGGFIDPGTGTNPPPAAPLVAFTSPQHNDVIDTVTTGSVTLTVAGIIDLSTGWVPDEVRGLYSNLDSSVYGEYSNVQADIDAGWTAITYDSTTGAFSFDITIEPDVQSQEQSWYISVDGNDSVKAEGHGSSIYINNVAGIGSTSYKAGVVSSRSSIKEMAVKAKMARKILRSRMSRR